MSLSFPLVSTIERVFNSIDLELFRSNNCDTKKSEKTPNVFYEQLLMRINLFAFSIAVQAYKLYGGIIRNIKSSHGV